MNEYITENGEIIDADEEMTPYKQACKKLTAFKLRLIETVAADPSLSKAPCLAAIVVYLGFLKVNKETLKPTEVYASNLKLMARGNIRTKVTAGLSRKLLVAEGYLVATGSTTKDGCVKFRIENPHDEKMRMHVREAEEFYGARDCLRKEIERQKKAAKAKGVIVTDTPKSARGDSNYTDRVIVTDTKYHRVHLRDSCSEGREESQEGNSGYRDLDDLNPYESFTIPDNDNEAEQILSHVGNVHPYIKTELRRMLMAGELTPALLMSNFGGGDGQSA